MGTNKSYSARLEIDNFTLLRLLSKGQMKVCELRCLDADTKKLIRELCLQACLENTGHHNA